MFGTKTPKRRHQVEYRVVMVGLLLTAAAGAPTTLTSWLIDGGLVFAIGVVFYTGRTLGKLTQVIADIERRLSYIEHSRRAERMGFDARDEDEGRQGDD